MSSYAADKLKFFTTEEYDEAVANMDTKPLESTETFNTIINTVYPDEETTVKMTRMKEDAVFHIANLYVKAKNIEGLKQLLIDLRPFFQEISKPRSAKIIRNLIDIVAHMPESTHFLILLCTESIQWCIQEKRNFLRQRLEARLASLYYDDKQYKAALTVIQKLIRQVKKFEDKPLMVEISLIESYVYLALKNIPKSKGSLTAARSNATSFYCPPLMQADIDMQAGVLCAVEKDFKTAFSYFYEAYEGYSTLGKDSIAVKALKYMMMGKIMSNQTSDVYNLIHSKAGLRYAGRSVEAMKAMADAVRHRNLAELDSVLSSYDDELGQDKVISSHVTFLRETLLDANLKRIITPYSRVSVAFVADKVGLGVDAVTTRLARLLIDKEIYGALEQHSGDIILHEPDVEDTLHLKCVEAIGELDKVVDMISLRTQTLVNSQ